MMMIQQSAWSVSPHTLLPFWEDMKNETTDRVIAETLAVAPFLDGMSAGHLGIMAECAMPGSFLGGEMIFREGDVANRFYLIREGSVALESRVGESNPIQIQTIGPGEVLGWSWLFPPYLWHFDARAVEPVKVLFIYGSRLREYCEDDHDFGYELVKRMAEVMVRRLQATSWQLFEISNLALRSQWEALQLAAQLGNTASSGPKRFRPARTSIQNKTQSIQKNDRTT